MYIYTYILYGNFRFRLLAHFDTFSFESGVLYIERGMGLAVV